VKQCLIVVAPDDQEMFRRRYGANPFASPASTELAERLNRWPKTIEAMQDAVTAAEADAVTVDDVLRSLSRRSESLRRRLGEKLGRVDRRPAAVSPRA
jgi:hypothetical protein